MLISRNVTHKNRFNIGGLQEDQGAKKVGIAGYHGGICGIIGWIAAKVFHKAVRIKIDNKVYYLNCKSLDNWRKRMAPEVAAVANKRNGVAAKEMILQVIDSRKGSVRETNQDQSQPKTNSQSLQLHQFESLGLSECTHPKLFEMYQHVHSTADFAKHCGSKTVFEPLGLSECACKGTAGAFDRLHNDRRNNLENAIVKQMTENMPDKNQTIRLLSMGSGGLMSDFLTLEKLVLAGFKRITIDCVDPEVIDPAKIERIQKFFADYPEVKIEIEAYNKIKHVPAEKTGYSAVIAVDYDTLYSFSFENKFTATKDIMSAYRRLHDNGFLALGFSKDDSLFGPKMAPMTVGSQASFIHCLAGDLALKLPQKEELVVGISSLRLAGASHLLFFSLVLALEKSPKAYQNISLLSLSNSYKDEGPKFKGMMESLFPNTNIEITFERQTNKKCDLFFTGNGQSEFDTKEYLKFLNKQALSYIFYQGGKLFRQINDQEDQRVQVL